MFYGLLTLRLFALLYMLAGTVFFSVLELFLFLL